MLNKLDIHNLYRTKKESTEIPFDMYLKKFPSVAKPVNVEKKSDPTEIERVSCMRMKSIKRIAHVFQKNIPAIRVKRTNTDLDKFIYDYSFGIKQDNGEQENTIWTLKRPEGNLFNIQVNEDDNVSMISGYLVKPDYAYYTNGDTSKGVDVINPKKVSLRQEKREKDDSISCLLAIRRLLLLGITCDYFRIVMAKIAISKQITIISKEQILFSFISLYMDKFIFSSNDIFLSRCTADVFERS